jgi:hypothetical protein
MGGFLCADRVEIFAHRKEDWTVVTEFTEVAPDNLEKEERTRSIQPCQRLNPGTVKFKIAAVGTAFPPNSRHGDKSLLQFQISVNRKRLPTYLREGQPDYFESLPVGKTIPSMSFAA